MPKKQYLSLQFRCLEPLSEILIAELAEMDYDSFWEQEDGFEAYIEASAFSKDDLQEVIGRYAALGEISYHSIQVEEKNWNVEWESNFEPITVEDQCLVRADFHQIAQDYPYEIVINPKMSFGTGHHATTYLMLSWQLELNQQGKKVMDAGCGTGILAIMARLRGANGIVAFDNNEWAVENSRENFELNQCPDIRMFLGTVTDLPEDNQYDIILANINRNVLLEELPYYATRLQEDGVLLLSGFYNYDASLIETKAAASGLIVRGRKEKSDWVALQLSF
jgi:ribosomal protein L11 methyltransferase